jgi:hypothetical protein
MARQRGQSLLGLVARGGSRALQLKRADRRHSRYSYRS